MWRSSHWIQRLSNWVLDCQISCSLTWSDNSIWIFSLSLSGYKKGLTTTTYLKFIFSAPSNLYHHVISTYHQTVSYFIKLTSALEMNFNRALQNVWENNVREEQHTRSCSRHIFREDFSFTLFSDLFSILNQIFFSLTLRLELVKRENWKQFHLKKKNY